MTLKSQNIILKTITLTAIIPVLYLLGISVFLLIPALFDSFKYNSILETLAILICIVFGILGAIAIFYQLLTKLKSKLILKILFLFLSIVGYFMFIAILTGIQGWKNMFDSLKNIKENLLDFYMVLWPIIVSGILLIFNIKLYLNLKLQNNNLNRTN